MRQHHNVLYVVTPKSRLRKRDAAVEVLRQGSPPARVPMHHLHSIVCFGPVFVSPWLMAACAEQGIIITFLTGEGRFLARVVGPQNGNVLLRLDQYQTAGIDRKLEIAKSFVIGKLVNCRTVLRRAAREALNGDSELLTRAADVLTVRIGAVSRTNSMDALRGIEGAGASEYYAAFPTLLRNDAFEWKGRSRRPPRDRSNAVLSFLYSMLALDCSSALQAVGLDPQVGFLHELRTGRPSLALDLMEELRPVLADRCLFSLCNRRQLQSKHFRCQSNGAVLLNEDGRRLLLAHYQDRKRKELNHSFLGERTQYGIVPLLQARLLARTVRGDLDAYPPFVMT